MRYELSLFLCTLLCWIGPLPLFAGTSPDVLKITEGSEQDIKPVLAVDAEGRVWVAWQRNRGSRYVKTDRCGHWMEAEWDIHARYYDGEEWLSETVAMAYGAEYLSFDIVADEDGKVWIGWNSIKILCGERHTFGASSYWEGEWHSVGPDTISTSQSFILSHRWFR